jgi:hypothetical protein
MEAQMSDEFATRASQLALKDLEDGLIQSSREYEDAQRTGDEYSAAVALKNYAQAQRDYEALAGTGQQQQQSGLSAAQRNFLSRRAAGGDDLSPARMRDYALAHTRAVNAGLQVDSPEYFAAIARHADSMGDGRQKPLDEREAAKLCGISDQEYAQGAAKLRALKAQGMYNERDG